MAVLNLNVGSEGQVVAPDYNRMELIFTNKLTKLQKRSGVVGKVVVITPVFSTRATIFNSDNGLRLSTSSIKTGEKQWFNNVVMPEEVRVHILKAFIAWYKGERGTPWYQSKLGEKTIVVSNKDSNETLGILNIFASGRLSAKQRDVGMIARASVQTEFGTVRGASIFRSKFDESLYFIPANEGTNDERIPAYRLTREAEAQVLAFLHENTNFGEEPQTSSGALALDDETKDMFPGADDEAETAPDEVPFSISDAEDAFQQ